ncbi:MAG: hypothetical protein JJU36_13175 [Phycisphaeraceae bacterium]|nr:hypothetical protein [Phycisphaeraceae bacterium]
MWTRVRRLVTRFHEDQRGAEGLEKLLLLAALILPLLGVLIFYGADLMDWLSEKWAGMRGDRRLDP